MSARAAGEQRSRRPRGLGAVRLSLDPPLLSVLEAQGNPVSLDVLPGIAHLSPGDEGWEVFLAAFPRAAARD